MIKSQIIRFFEDRPFVPFAIFTSDGRTFDVAHPEQAHFGRYAEVIMYFYDDLRIEVIDSQQIVSLKTLKPVDISTYGG